METVNTDLNKVSFVRRDWRKKITVYNMISERISKSLEKYLATLEMYLEMDEIKKQEIDIILGKEFKQTVSAFANLLDYSLILKEKKLK